MITKIIRAYIFFFLVAATKDNQDIMRIEMQWRKEREERSRVTVYIKKKKFPHVPRWQLN